MKRLNVIWIIIIAVFFCAKLNAQSVEFCESVDNSGNPVKATTVFAIDKKEGGKIKVLTKLTHRVGTDKVFYEVHKVQQDGSEKYERTLNGDVKADQTWFWQDVTFKEEGVYNVYVFDGDMNKIAAGNITVQYY